MNRAKTDRFGKPISRYFTTSGFPRLKLYREMEKAKAQRAARLAAFADHVYAASEPIRARVVIESGDKPYIVKAGDIELARFARVDHASDFANEHNDKGEQCVTCGKNSWECEHYEESEAGQ